MSESDRLNRLIDKILDLEKFETGQQKIHTTKKNIFKTVENAIEPLQQLIRNKNITIDLDFKNDIEIDYDEDRIIQVITNLLANAITFCPEENGIIRIALYEEEQHIAIVVEDNGKGIDENDFESIFDKFYQCTNQNLKKPLGSGLGLAISKQIIEIHKGKIWAEAGEKGAKLTFTLPKNTF